MKKLNKITLEKSISRHSLLANGEVARRGINDYQNYITLKKLRGEMLRLFHAHEYRKCINVCEKIMKSYGKLPLVTLLHVTSQNRLKK